MLIEPKAQGVLRHAGDEGRAFPGRQTFLGLTRELRVQQFDRQDIAATIPDILRDQLDAAGKEITELAELPHRLGETRAQAVHMGASLGCGDQIDVALRDSLATFCKPDHRPVGGLAVAFHGAHERLLGHDGQVPERIQEIILEPGLVAPLGALAGALIEEGHPQAGAKHRLGPQHVHQLTHRELGAVEEPRIGPEPQSSTGVVAPYLADLLQRRDLFAVGEGHVVFLAVALDPHLQMLRQGVDHRHANPMQSAGEAVILVGKLAARVQSGEDHLHARQPLFGMNVHRHPPAVVFDLQ